MSGFSRDRQCLWVLIFVRMIVCAMLCCAVLSAKNFFCEQLHLAFHKKIDNLIVWTLLGVFANCEFSHDWISKWKIEDFWVADVHYFHLKHDYTYIWSSLSLAYNLICCNLSNFVVSSTYACSELCLLAMFNFSFPRCILYRFQWSIMF